MTRERRTSYLRNREQDIQTCEAALEAADFRTLQEITHRIKGGAALFGFEPMAEIAIRIEKAAEGGDANQIRALLTEFSALIQKTYSNLE